MLTRFVRVQLVIFSVLSLIAIMAMVLVYMQVPMLLGIGRMTVTLQLPTTGGLYRFSNVTYRGTEIGKVTSVEPTPEGAQATLSLDASRKIPADLRAEVRSVSAIGEQYVDLIPRSDSGPYLSDGSVITPGDTVVPQSVGPVLDQVSELVGSVPKNRLGELLNETFTGLDGAGYDLGSLLDSASHVAQSFNEVRDQTHDLMEASAPLTDSLAAASEDSRVWSRNLAGVTGQLVANDGDLRTLLHNGPAAFDETRHLFEQLKPTLPILLANLTTIGQIGITYHPSLEQVLVLLPPLTAFYTANTPNNNLTGIAIGDFRMTVGDPPACTVGFLPPSAWRPPEDTSETDTPDGLYCKLPQDSPLAVRGARNYPCMDHPGKRAPTVAICNSDRGFEPIAERPHTTGPYPFDPNLVSQGLPVDSRINSEDHLYAPPEGTPPPPAQTPPAAVPPPPGGSTPAPPNPLPETANPAEATPNSFTTSEERTATSVAAVEYDPGTGKYMAPGGGVYLDMTLTRRGEPRTWQQLVLAEN